MRFTFSELPDTLQGKELVRRINLEFKRLANALAIETHIVKTVAADYTLKSEDRMLRVDTSSGARTVTLMLARSASGIPFTIRNVGTVYDATVAVQRPATETIGDTVSTSLTLVPGASVDLTAGSVTHWEII